MFNTFFVYVSVCVWLTINILAMASVAVVSTRPCVIVAAFFRCRFCLFGAEYFLLFLVMATAIPACFTRFTAFGIIFVVVVGVRCFFFSLVSLSLSLSVSFSFYNSYNCNGPFLYILNNGLDIHQSTFYVVSQLVQPAT